MSRPVPDRSTDHAPRVVSHGCARHATRSVLTSGLAPLVFEEVAHHLGRGPQPAEFVVGELIQSQTETGHGHRLLHTPSAVHGGAEIFHGMEGHRRILAAYHRTFERAQQPAVGRAGL